MPARWNINEREENKSSVTSHSKVVSGYPSGPVAPSNTHAALRVQCRPPGRSSSTRTFARATSTHAPRPQDPPQFSNSPNKTPELPLALLFLLFPLVPPLHAALAALGHRPFPFLFVLILPLSPPPSFISFSSHPYRQPQVSAESSDTPSILTRVRPDRVIRHGSTR